LPPLDFHLGSYTMATQAHASSVFPFSIQTVWEQLRDFTFPARLLPSVVASTKLIQGASPLEVGAVREVVWKSGEKRQHRLIDLSDQWRRVVWETIAAEPAAETAASMATLRLHRVSETNETLVEWTVEFSADVPGPAIRFEQRALQDSLFEIKCTLQKNRRALILGAGLVARPIIHYLAEKGYQVTVASRTLERAREICEGARGVRVVQLDVERSEHAALLDELTEATDAVISMLPYLFHPVAARAALRHRKHFLTTSYVSAAMREMEEEARRLGLVFINECGVDPGTDHMSAKRVIDAVHARGGRVLEFTSYCGGLPAPDANTNPFGYKLSWAPRGVLLAARNDALFLRDGKRVDIPGRSLFAEGSYEVHQVAGFTLEAYPNRDSTQYQEMYGLPEARTLVRGTYRNRGWCPTLKAFVDLGLLDLTERADVAGRSYADLMRELLQAPSDEEKDLRAAVQSRASLPADQAAQILDRFAWLGLFSREVRVGPRVRTALDAVCQLFVERMQYAEGERDMIVMRHTFQVEYADRFETLSSSLIDFGLRGGDTSMSRTVSYPVAVAARLVLEGRYTRPGLSIPTCPELYEPILRELEALNIHFVERTEAVRPK
jgi:saccharopine dehydrogenase-like NADP-dependent oxidoreductase